MKKVIVDFDNTFGVYGRDLDDALALLYLIKSENIDPVLVTTSFGNDKADIVKEATIKLFTDLNIDIPLSFYGEGGAESIVACINKYENDINLISLGSTSNISRALELDKSIANKVDKYIAMGGVSEPLNINGKIMDELNLSIDYKSTVKVLSTFNKPFIITGNNCLDFGLKPKEIFEILGEDNKLLSYLQEGAKMWFDYHLNSYDIDYVIIWDLIAAIFLDKDEIFDQKKFRVNLKEENLKYGFLEEDENGVEIILPRLKNIDLYKKVFREVWSNKL